MDWRAVEANEKKLDEMIAEEGKNDDFPSQCQVSAWKLQKAIMRGWLAWNAEHTSQSQVQMHGFAAAIGTMVCEFVANHKFFEIGADEQMMPVDPKDMIIQLVNEIGVVALHVQDMEKDDRVAHVGVNLKGRSDG